MKASNWSVSELTWTNAKYGLLLSNFYDKNDFTKMMPQ